MNDHPISSRTAVRVRPAVAADLPSVVAEHRASLPDGLYARLGGGFLRRYHAAYLASSGTAVFVAELDGRPVGFVSGVVSVADHRVSMRQAWPGLAGAALLALLSRPALLVRVLSSHMAASYLRVSARLLLRADTPLDRAADSTGVLTYLAVARTARRRGAGDALLDAFLRRARDHGCTKVTLATQRGAQGAGEFYARRGWTPDSLRSTANGRSLQVMARTWPAEESAANSCAWPREPALVATSPASPSRRTT